MCIYCAGPQAGTVAQGGGKSKLQSIRDIERFMENYPEFKKQQGMVAKHVTLTSVLSAMVDRRNLLDVSELEQELACDESLTDSFDRIDALMPDANMSAHDKLRLVLLYSLRYQMEGERETRFLERSLADTLDSDLDKDKLASIGLLRKLAGVSVRGSDIFNKRGVMGAAKGIVKRQMQGVKGVSNVLTRYQPLLASRLAAIKMGGLPALRESEFKLLRNHPRSPAPKPQHILVFIVGGMCLCLSPCLCLFLFPCLSVEVIEVFWSLVLAPACSPSLSFHWMPQDGCMVCGALSWCVRRLAARRRVYGLASTSTCSCINMLPSLLHVLHDMWWSTISRSAP